MTDETQDEQAPTPKARRVAPLSDEQVALNDLNRMRDLYASQDKVAIKTREDEWVQINGYTFVIKAGERVEVPVDVRDLLEQAGRI